MNLSKVKQRLSKYEKRALDFIYSEKKNSSNWLNMIFITALILLIAKSSLLAGDLNNLITPTADQPVGTSLEEASKGVLCVIKEALSGWTGWVLIAIGMLLSIWDYFIQKQGYILVVSILGIIALVVLRTVLPSCGGS